MNSKRKKKTLERMQSLISVFQWNSFFFFNGQVCVCGFVSLSFYHVPEPVSESEKKKNQLLLEIFQHFFHRNDLMWNFIKIHFFRANSSLKKTENQMNAMMNSIEIYIILCLFSVDGSFQMHTHTHKKLKVEEFFFCKKKLLFKWSL